MVKAESVGIGRFMLDEYIFGVVSRISPEAPVPVLEVKKRQIKLGGAGNVVNNLVSLGASATVLTRIGDDHHGNFLRKELEKRKVDIRYIWVDSAVHTIIKTRIIAKNQQVLRYDQEKIQEIPKEYEQYIEEHLEEIWKGIQVVLISDYGKGTVTKKLAQSVIQLARKKGIPVIVDPKGNDYSKYYQATICTPNLKELQLVSGCVGESEEQIWEMGKKLCEAIELKYLLVTRSEKGISCLFNGGARKKDFLATAKEVVDVTGAGDTVISVVALSIASGYSIEMACRLANDAASIVISRFGCATTTIEEIRELSCHKNEKIIEAERLASVLEECKRQGKKIVFTNGCFDLLHAGHISSFEQAKKYGDILVVGLNSDRSVRRMKGEKRPIIEETYRAKLLASLTIVDYVTIFTEDTPEKLIIKLKPDVLVKGKDWKGKFVAGQEFIEQNGGMVEWMELEQGLSTTNIVEKIRTVYAEIEK